MSESTSARLVGISHITLNVIDLEESVRFYCQVLDFRPLFEFDTDDFDRRLLRHPSGIILGLTVHRHPEAGTGFVEQSTGLDHLSFAVDSEESLEAWVDRLGGAGVAHSGIQRSEATGSVLIPFRDPSDIQLELYVMPPQ
ncbi:MAG: VOC family protein [Candidatus Nanopelagicales bacterium]